MYLLVLHLQLNEVMSTAMFVASSVTALMAQTKEHRTVCVQMILMQELNYKPVQDIMLPVRYVDLIIPPN